MAKTKKTSKKMAPKATKPNWKPDLPFNDLLELPPAAELETRIVLKACIEARATLAELKPAPN